MKYYGETMTINASFLIAHKNIWKKLMPLYEKQLQLSKNSKYAHDEETILYLIWKDNKDLFCDIKNMNKDDFSLEQKYEFHVYAKKRSGHHYIIDNILKLLGGEKEVDFFNNINLNQEGIKFIQKNISNNKHIIVNIEDPKEINNFHISLNHKVINIIVLRDILNNYASILQFHERTKNEPNLYNMQNNWNQFCNIDYFLNTYNICFNEAIGKTNFLDNKIVINYTKSINNIERELKPIIKLLNCSFTDPSNNISSKFGSSFKDNCNYNERYLDFIKKKDDRMLKLILDNKLNNIYKKNNYFPFIPEFKLNYEKFRSPLNLITSNSICCEIGVWKGDFSKQILKRNPKKLYLIDPWAFQKNNKGKWYSGLIAKNEKDMNNIYDDVVKYMLKYKNSCIIRKYSKDALHDFNDNYFDWIYIDGDHEYNSVFNDLELSFKKIKNDGFLTGDDYFWTNCDKVYTVQRAVNDFLKKTDLSCIVDQNGQFIIKVKKSLSKTNFESAKQFVEMKIKHNNESLSGPGSHINNTNETINLINKTIKKYNIKTILDLGCGDWNWFRLIDIEGVSYTGWDAHEGMIKLNTKKYGKANIHFKVKDIILDEYPKTDLIICRDVLFHLDISFAKKCINKVKNSCKYFISTSFNDIEKNTNINKHYQIKGWGFYRINLNIYPFNLKKYMIESINEKNNSKIGAERFINLYIFN
jgi:SAM-dependent methyltransferase